MTMSGVRNGFMKIEAICCSAVILMLMVLVSSPAYSQLLAPVYPGTVMVEQDQKEAVFLVKDDIEQVLDYYRQRLGEPEELRQGSGWSDDGRKYHWIVKRHYAEFGGVDISTRRPLDHDAVSDPVHLPQGMAGAHQVCFSHELLAPLARMAVRLPDREGADFVEACRRYVHLTWSFFQDTDELDRHGRRLTMDKYLLVRHQDKIRPPSAETMHEAYAKMQALAMAGRIEEAREMAQQLGSTPVQQGDDWVGWIQLLKDIDEHAYQTRIRISTDPATWPEWRYDKG